MVKKKYKRKKSLFRNIFIRNIFFAILFFLTVLICSLKYLDYYTMNNKHISVPNFSGIHVSQLDSVFNSNDLRYIIIDSIYDQKKVKGVIVNQDPKNGMFVKKNRRIYLTINSIQKRKVFFPNIYDLTLRQAISKLKKSGIKIGKLSYKPNLAENRILDYSVNGTKIKPGQEIFEGTTIDLLVGKGISSEKVSVPNLIGLSRLEANIVLKTASLNLGAEIFNGKINDSSNVYVYKQRPAAGEKRKVNIGSSIDLFFK